MHDAIPAYRRDADGSVVPCEYRGERFVELLPSPPPSLLDPPMVTLTRRQRRQAARSRSRSWRWAPGRRRALRIDRKQIDHSAFARKTRMMVGRMFRFGSLVAILYTDGGDDPTERDVLAMWRAFLREVAMP